LIALQLLPIVYSATGGVGRNGASVTIRALWLFKHDNPLYSCQPFELEKMVRPTAKPGVTISSSWDDYEMPTVTEVQKKMADAGIKGITIYELKQELLDKQRNISDVLGMLPDQLNKIADIRYSGLLVVEAVNANLNGDPDRGGAPRMDSLGYGWYTPSSIKAKLRQMIDEKEALAWKDLKKKFPGLKEEEHDILEKRERDFNTLMDLAQKNPEGFLSRFWDSRIFGNCFLDSRKKDNADSSEED